MSANMKKLISALLTLAVLCCPMVGFAAETATDTDITVVEYDHIGEFIAENNSAVRAVMQSYKMLDVQIRALQSEIDDLDRAFGVPSGGNEALDAIFYSGLIDQIKIRDDAIKDLRAELRFMDRDLDRAAGGQVHAARILFLRHHILSEQMDTAQRTLDDARKDLELNRILREIGFIPQSVIDVLERKITSGNDSIRAISRTMDDNIKTLSNILWIRTPVSLGVLPELEFERVSKRDLVEDLAAYTLSAPDVQEKKTALDNARIVLNRHSGIVSRHAFQVALEDYERARELAALDFPGVYQALLDIYEDYINSTAVKDAETELGRMRIQFVAGHVPWSSVVSAEREVLYAKSMHEQERISVYIALLEYEFGLINWV